MNFLTEKEKLRGVHQKICLLLRTSTREKNEISFVRPELSCANVRFKSKHVTILEAGLFVETINCTTGKCHRVIFIY